MRNGLFLDGIALVAYPYHSTRILVRFESPQLTVVATQAPPKSVNKQLNAESSGDSLWAVIPLEAR